MFWMQNNKEVDQDQLDAIISGEDSDFEFEVDEVSDIVFEDLEGYPDVFHEKGDDNEEETVNFKFIMDGLFASFDTDDIESWLDFIESLHNIKTVATPKKIFFKVDEEYYSFFCAGNSHIVIGKEPVKYIPPVIKELIDCVSMTS